MGKSKEPQTANGHKRHLLADDPFALESADRHSKKAKLLDDDSDDEDANEGHTLKVNDEYKRRFDYNKKREEKHRCAWSLYYRDFYLLTCHSGGKVRQE